MKATQCKKCGSTDLATRSALCKLCHNEYTREHYKNNVQYYKEKSARNRLPRYRLHGLTDEQYQVLLDKTGGLCYICGDKATKIDHDHRCCAGSLSCGKCVRGLLCNGCNSGIGFLKDDPNVITRAAAYVTAAAMAPLTD